LKEAAARELKEETGLFLSSKDDLIEISRREDDTGTLVVTFYCKDPGGKLNPNPGEPPCMFLSWGCLTNRFFGAYPKHNQKIKEKYHSFVRNLT
jgi:8-oxo-dGTP pyrophosphatase MutT (NUDIX family)